jgi:hypothetical protein
MNFQVLAVFILPLLTGILLAHLVWPDRTLRGVLLKGSLGIGIGLGAQSLVYFAYLLLFAGQNWFIVIQLGAFMAVLVLTVRGERKHGYRILPVGWRPQLAGSGGVLVSIAGVVFLISILSTANYLLRRRQGDWDAWMMYNRAARFAYLDQAHWLQSFSPRMDPLFHADYPLLLAMNIASGWQALGRDTAGVPMVQSGLFAIGCVGLIASSVGSVKSIGQAALAVIVLWGLPVFVNEGARQTADVPLAFYILATGSLLFMYALHPHPGFLALSGLTAGLAAWTKNEGAVLVIGASLALLVVIRGHFAWRSLISYGAGLAAPLAVLLYFKIYLAPPGDMLSGGAARLGQQASDLARHAEILRYFWREITGFGSWGIGLLSSLGIIPILVLYYAVFHAAISPAGRKASSAVAAILGVELLGDYGAFLITPYDLTWHLSYSTERLVLQIFPLLLFLILCASLPAESVLSPGTAHSSGVRHAIDN